MQFKYENATLEFKWTVSRGRDTYGYNICSLYVDGVKVSSCSGGGYDMKGTALGNWIEAEMQQDLIALYNKPEVFPHITRWNRDTGKTERCAEERCYGGELRLYGMTAYWNNGKLERIVLDGACGFQSMEDILKAIGYSLEYVPIRSKDNSLYKLRTIATVEAR